MMIFGFLRQNLMTEAVAVAFSIAWPEGAVEPGPGEAQARLRLVAFRRGVFWGLTPPRGGLSWASWLVGCCVLAGRCGCWRSCRWCQSTGAGTGRCMTR